MGKSDDKLFWQRYARLYSPFMKSSKRLYHEICSRMRPYLNRNMNVLELACGSGQLSFPLSRFVRLWEATDFSENMIAEAKKQVRSSRLHFSVQDATKLPYRAEVFDAVVIANALHIMPDPDMALSEIYRVLKPGGLLFAPTFFQGKGRSFRFRMRAMEFLGFHVYHRWDEKGLAGYLTGHGFTVLEHDTIGGGLMPLCFIVGKKG